MTNLVTATEFTPTSTTHTEAIILATTLAIQSESINTIGNSDDDSIENRQAPLTARVLT